MARGTLSLELTDRILALPRDIVRHDLEQMALYHIGVTCDSIPDNYDPDGYTGILSNCVILLGEMGNAQAALQIAMRMFELGNEEDLNYVDEMDEWKMGDILKRAKLPQKRLSRV